MHFLYCPKKPAGAHSVFRKGRDPFPKKTRTHSPRRNLVQKELAHSLVAETKALSLFWQTNRVSATNLLVANMNAPINTSWHTKSANCNVRMGEIQAYSFCMQQKAIVCVSYGPKLSSQDLHARTYPCDNLVLLTFTVAAVATTMHITI